MIFLIISDGKLFAIIEGISDDVLVIRDDYL